MTLHQNKYAILVDGAFLLRKLYEKHKQQVSSDQIVQYCRNLGSHTALIDMRLLRIYYYDAPPADDVLKQPISNSPLDLSTTTRAKHAKRLLDRLVLEADFALRLGETLIPSREPFRIKSGSARALSKNPFVLSDNDFILNIQQKGVDMRIGLDAARLALKQLVDTLVVVTSDSDFIPVLKFVRREGLRVGLDTLGHSVVPKLKHHTDFVIS